MSVGVVSVSALFHHHHPDPLEWVCERNALLVLADVQLVIHLPLLPFPLPPPMPTPTPTSLAAMLLQVLVGEEGGGALPLAQQRVNRDLSKQFLNIMQRNPICITLQ